jgi:hypothetical protein
MNPGLSSQGDLWRNRFGNHLGCVSSCSWWVLSSRARGSPSRVAAAHNGLAHSRGSPMAVRSMSMETFG